MKFISFRTVSILWVLLFVFQNKSNAQNTKTKLDEINIISSFKPSIVKSGKLEFFPEIPLRDTNSFRFNYSFDVVDFKTPLPAFSLKPLAYQVPEELDGQNKAFVKIGGGNFRTPFLSAGFETKVDKNIFSIGLNHISSKGNLSNQQYANTKINTGYSRLISSNQSLDFNIGYQGDAYKTYGFDTSKFSFGDDQLKQRYNLYNFTAGYNLVADKDASLIFMPKVNLLLLSTRRGATETSFDAELPVSYALANDMKLSTAINFSQVRLKNEVDTSKSIALLQVPIRFEYTSDRFYVNAGFATVFRNNKLVFVPEARVIYSLEKNSLVRLVGGISNDFRVNSLTSLYEINPFIFTPSGLDIFQQSKYFAGLDLLSNKGFSWKSKLGFVNFKNLPLFVNERSLSTEVSGKDFVVLRETSANALFIDGALGYLINDRISLEADFIAYSFQPQKKYSKPYGFVPFDLSFGIKWKPIQPINLKFLGNYLAGNWALGIGNLDAKTKGIMDLSLGVDYNLNKKWTLWMDLNNIANAKYQRWNGYTSFGFNFLVGIKFNFTQLVQ